MKKFSEYIARFFDKRIYVFLTVFLVIGVFDLIAIKYSLYFFHEWIDIPVHFLAGFFVGALYFYLIYSNPRTRKLIRVPRKQQNVFDTSVFWVFVTAMTWEIVEFLFGRSYISPAYFPDTFLDIVATTFGGYVLYLFYFKVIETIRREERKSIVEEEIVETK